MANIVTYTNRCCPRCSSEKFEQIGEKIRCLSCGAECYPGSLKPVSHDNNGTLAASSSMPQPDFSKPSVDLNCPTSPAQPSTPISPSTPKMNFCPNCGFKLLGPSKFCPNCGNQLGISGAPQVATQPASVGGGSADSGMTKDDLVSCLFLYAERLDLLERIISNISYKGQAKYMPASPELILSNYIDWNSLYPFSKRGLIKEQWDLLEEKNREHHKSLQVFCYSQIPVIGQEMFRLESTSLSSLYPLYKTAYQAFAECKSHEGSLVYERFNGVDKEELRFLVTPGFLAKPLMLETEFVSKMSDPTNVRRLFTDFSKVGKYDDKFCTWCFETPYSKNREKGSINRVYLAYSTTKAYTINVGLFKKKEETRYEEVVERSFACNDLQEKIIDEIYRGVGRYFSEAKRSLPIIFDSIDEIALGLKPLIARFSLPEEYRTSKDAVALARILQTGKADTWKEAINAYDTEVYRRQVLGSLMDIKVELANLNRTVNAVRALSEANLAISVAALTEMKTMNDLLADQKKKLASIARSTFITAVFGD